LEGKDNGKSNGLEDIIGELRELAKRKPLSDIDLARAKELMCKLKGMGLTNMEISELTDGGWKEPTVKLYTKGVTVKDRSPKKNILELLSQLVDMGLTLADVKAFILTKKDLDSKGIGLEGISNLLDEAKRLKVDLEEIVKIQISLKNSGLSIRQLSEILSYKAELDKIDVTIKLLGEIVQASRVYGDAGKILEALNAYGALRAIQEDLKKIYSEKEKDEDQAKRLRSEVVELEKSIASAENALKTYEMIKALGFDESTYSRLKASSEKYGGVDSVLDAVNFFADLTEIKRKKENLEAELKKVQADYAHLQTVIGICEVLLYKYRFSVAAINDIYETAKSYGEPLQILKAISQYGETKKIQAEIDVLNKRKEELQSTVKELERQLQELEVTITALRTSIDDALTPIRNEITKNVDYVIKKFVETLGDMSSQYEQYAQRYGELKADAGKLEEDLKLGRLILLLIKYPSEARQVPLKYDVLILSGIVDHCRMIGVNPTFKLQDVVGANHWNIGHYTVELIELIEWALKGLKKATPQG